MVLVCLWFLDNVNKLMTLSSREEELTISLKNVGDQLFQAYSTLQNAYTEVQQLLTIKQQVCSWSNSFAYWKIENKWLFIPTVSFCNCQYIQIECKTIHHKFFCYQVTSEMASLRAKRIQFLQDMMGKICFSVLANDIFYLGLLIIVHNECLCLNVLSDPS